VLVRANSAQGSLLEISALLLDERSQFVALRRTEVEWLLDRSGL
jgi:hypothetical protein